MTEDSLPTDILAHMIAINNVPPPPLRSIPRLKVRKTINYGQLNALCHIRGLESRRNSSLYLAAHDTFIKQYPQIFLHEKTVLPKVPQPVEKRKSDLQIDQKISQPVKSHNISLYLSEARGGPCINEGELSESKFQKFLDILKKLPVYRTIHEHNFVWKMLKNIPALTSQLRSEHLKILSKKVMSETWIKGSTVIGDDGLYIMLTGHARRRVKVFRSLIEEEDSIVSSISRESFLFDVDLKDSTVVEFYVPSKKLTVKKWGVFGSLEVRPDMDECERSIVTDDDCEILKIPTKEYEKLKLEKVKRENAQKLKLIRKCPFYEIWPTLSIYELVSLSTFKIFPPGHVLVESGDIISFVGFINSGYCNIYRNIVGLVDLSLKVKKIKKLVYMGKLKERESFGEISILLQSPFTCTIITGREVEMAIIEDKDILALDPITKELMIQTAKPTFGHLTEEDVKNEYIKKVQEKEWKYFKNKTIQGIFQSKGVLPGFGKWEHDWSTIPKNFKSSLITYT
ncbi:cyclic nucleotide-binding domain-containing protein 1 isoform X3 [Rattus norvegicus]|uniref:Cyclic nucleotide binding domain containing 1 n=1 Tax=Rattus norvegicus TaxID=10116 RepID=A0A0G2K3B6_RAT|nr:cyclic nucleotide-binding domain-containing protein 1 isoform X1 [Rattus norvegicus]|eukprot:XP_017449190.1 PREDICTED: cyclic nucleotide-binding domain-containing protein 1 isoform X1 [Rattus norvegicus]